MKKVLVVFFTLLIFGCNTTPKESISTDSFHLTSNDPEYGYTEKKPIELGSFLRGTKSASAHIEYFDGLIGPNGEKVKVTRLGSCCAFEDKSMPFGGGLLDRYQLTYEGQEKPAIIYVNLYKFNKPLAPKGFSLL
ncbi:hypothetical protein [Pseudoalteromonas peptidolytica]|uniref:2-dehydro-3-deoxyphosphooctonate aldolase n=1 Tax=Pseudoalteromonas peptidolytica F12-50-A1 TaxID=1315280 RepID=A0A8I0N108_9GAMM|nr:hypothetical protein [Pseudoalteromonas peptidolytica]MBE0348569.1 hypothetical protein [Pseudoalteromonas peptidolytica F12-50-A1]NLR15793.1 hypothetical protein [Pseudoalteromonas peptidolytica]GEK10963.1 hypothetical protein PPE03_32120 [Pseudoalteromonas peptidolytica]